VRMKSRQAPSAKAVRVGLTCVSTSGEGVLAIAFMIRFCTVFKNKSVTSKRKRRALDVMIERKNLGWGRAHREDKPKGLKRCFYIYLLLLTPAAKLSAGMKTPASLSPDNLGYKVGKISHREICPAGI